MQQFRIRTSLAQRLCTAFLLALVPFSGHALEFEFPAEASLTLDRQQAFSSYALPIGPYNKDAMQTQMIEGAVSQAAWSLQAKGLTTLQIFSPLRAQLAAAGYKILYECETNVCGGFDFRFGADIAAEPAMHIDLGDFRYLSAERAGVDGPDYLAMFVSRSSALGFVQVTQIGKSQVVPASTAVQIAPTPEPIAKNPQVTTLGEGLAKQGSVALDDLIFGSGAADLEAGEYASLDALADYLRANPNNKVTLVGHTDASGGLAGNIALSRERAASVRARMINSYDIPADQVTSDGVGYLAPRDSNSTDQGRTRNRRVEVMLLVNPS